MTTIDTIRDALLVEIAAQLGAGYNELAYTEDVSKNSWRSNHNRYGVRALAADQVETVTKYVTMSQEFEIVLTKSYYESNIDDSGQIGANLENQGLMLDIFKRLVNNKGGAPSVVLNITGLSLSSPEYLTEEKVAVQRASINVFYRFSLI